MSNETFKANITFLQELDTTVVQQQVRYIVVTSVLILLCAIAVVVNAKILLTVRWIRRPISSILFMSLSLALADTINATLLGTGFVVNSLLPYGLFVGTISPCVIFTLDAFRLSCILITMNHLLALAGIHYVGIQCPFESRRWLTHRNITILVIFIWKIPIIYIFTYFASFEQTGFRGQCNDSSTIYEPLLKQRFRGIFATLLIIPLGLMFGIYCHISIIVKKHQASRQWFNRHSRHGHNSHQDHERQFERNLKAIWTTLLILLSYLICFMPSSLAFILACSDCYYVLGQIDKDTSFIIFSIGNFLLVTKPLLNPLIYASRMHEIRNATRLMNDSCKKHLCLMQSETICDNAGDIRLQRFSYVSESSRRQNCTSISSAQTNNGFAVRSLRRKPEDVGINL